MDNSGKYNCIIVDDDEIDRLTTLSFARKYPFLRIVGAYASVREAMNVMEGTAMQVLLSDIDMPDTNGLDFRRKVMDIPVCVFITSFQDFAVESFELAALDFLVKPLKAERFARTMARVQEYLDAKQKATLYEYSLGADTVFIKEGHNFIKIKLHEIVYLEALKDYTAIVTAEKKYAVLSPIGNLLKENHFKTFIRVHRSYAVQKHLIQAITPTHVIINKTDIPIGRSYKESLEEIKM